jgi:FMN phosphatase YigB (HAD superfamily)
MIIFDLDGTIANVDARRKAAYEAQDILKLDVPNELVVSVLRDLREQGKHIVIVSARNDKNRAVIEEWLAKYGIHYDALYMRPDGDYRPDNVFKQELLDNIRKGGEDLIERVYDDCIQVVPRDKGEF